MPKQRCVLCARAVHENYKPFCSRRCADVDLNRWLSEGYRIPVQDEDFPTDPARADCGRGVELTPNAPDDKTRH